MLKAPPAAGRLRAGPPARCLEILLVEDHADTARALTLLLGRDGYRVRSAGSVAEALAVADEGKFDLLICDMQLPDGTCHDVLRELRGKLGPDVLAIVLSGHDSPRHRAASLASGFAEHLVKPLSMEQLEEAIHRVCGQAAA